MADDRISLMDEARKEAVEEAIDGVMFARAELVRPAVGSKRPREDVLAEHDRFVNVPGIAEAHYDELQARFKLSREQPIPLRFVYLAILAKQELDKEAAKTAHKVGSEMPQPFEGSLGFGGSNGSVSV